MASCLNFCQENETPYFKIKGSAKDDPSIANGKPAAKEWSPGSYSNRPIIWSYLSTKDRLPGVSLFNSKLERYSMNLRG
ncbi:unnamed protein product [Urochloa humidicola]